MVRTSKKPNSLIGDQRKPENYPTNDDETPIDNHKTKICIAGGTNSM